MRIKIEAEGNISDPFLMPFPGLPIYANQQGRNTEDLNTMSNNNNKKERDNGVPHGEKHIHNKL